jgi:DNA helicase II / ATP-dependent DNA helicase PcrA
MLGGNFVEKLAGETASPSTQPSALSIQPVSGNRHSAVGLGPEDSADSAAGGPSPVSDAAEENDSSFDFGSNEQHELFGSWAEEPDAPVETRHAACPDAASTQRAQEPSLSLSSTETGHAPSLPAGRGNPNSADDPVEGFRSPGGAATLPEVIKFLIDRTRYVKVLEDEGSPEAFSRIENLQELANAARDSADRAETLGEFLDHAALVSDTDQYEEGSRITLMTLHAAKGLEFPLVFLAGMEEGLFPSSRTFLNPEQIEEERRLCYVGMTRAMDTLVLSRARYRRRYGSDLPDASVPSRFLEEIPPQLMEEIGTSSRRSGNREPAFSEVDEGRHYSYEDEDQSASSRARLGRSLAAEKPYSTKRNGTTGSPYQSIDNIADFFASRGKKFSRPKVEVPEPAGKRGFRPGQRVRHPKYGEGTVYKREGDGDDAKITVQFPQAGLKKLVEKFAQLERV